MKSDEEWITELEDRCLPKDNSWMDVHECFQVNEGCNGKRKQGIFYNFIICIFTYKYYIKNYLTLIYHSF